MIPAGILCLSVLTITWLIGGGVGGWVYVVVYLLACGTGLPLGFWLFGRRHAAGWVAGAALGYGLTAFAWGAVIQLGLAHSAAFVLAALVPAACLALTLGRKRPCVTLPSWTSRDTRALLLTLLLVPALMAPPFLRIGKRDEEGRSRYRAYFTADYLWHVALTSELARFASPPRNPYLASEPLHYYWTYFNVPAVLTAVRGAPAAVEAHVKVNAFCAGLLFLSCIFVAAWAAVPRSWLVAAAVVLTVTASSAEGMYAVWDVWQRGAPLSQMRSLNIDAITSWWLGSLTMDGLPRSLWYTPQHAFACALALIAIVIVAADHVRRPAAAALAAGIALGLALVCSPFLGGAFSVIYGLTAAWRAMGRPDAPRRLLVAAIASLPVAAALGWCVMSGTFEGAGGAVAIGLSDRASKAPIRTLALVLGPVLVAASAAAVPGAWRRHPARSGAVSLAIGLFLFYFVTLTKEPVWVGWRAGQIILVTVPALAACGLAWLLDRPRGRLFAPAVFVLLLCAGLPTTLIDTRNASDVEHTAMGPGFRWTVVVPRHTEAATAWIRNVTPDTSVVQMSVAPRGRETWTLIPTFAQRRMAAGQPISLLRMPAYDDASAKVDAMYRTTDAADAWRTAHALHLDYIFVDAVERRAFGPAAIDKFHNPRFFQPVFWTGSAEVIKVQ